MIILGSGNFTLVTLLLYKLIGALTGVANGAKFGSVVLLKTVVLFWLHTH